jgi:hypothetical protein
MAQNFGLQEYLQLPSPPNQNSAGASLQAQVSPALNMQLNPPTWRFSLTAAGTRLIPAGRWLVSSTGAHTAVEWLDPVQQQWFVLAGNVSGGFGIIIQSDGCNFRVANLSGAATSATVGAAGSGYASSGTIVTPSAGNSVWQAIVGGAVGSSITVTAGGAGYTMPPHVYFGYPPAPGVPAQAHAVLSGGAVSSITLDVAGAGYVTAPPIYIGADPADPAWQAGLVTSKATATCVLTGSGTVTAVLLVNFGDAQASAPTLSITGAGSSATATVNPSSWVSEATDTTVVLQPAP